jgi:uncharacterized protein (DUF1778 family)
METKSKRIDLRASEKNEKDLQRASEKTGEKTITGTIFKSVEQVANMEPYSIKEFLLRDLTAVYRLALQYLKNIAAEYSSLSIGPITMAELQQIADINFTDIKKRFYATIESDVSNVKSKIVIANLLAGVEETFKEFKTNSERNISEFQAVGFMGGKAFHMEIQYYTIIEGVVSFTDADRERLKQKYCCIYLDLPAKEKYVQLMEETFTGLCELKRMLVENNIGNVFSEPGVQVGMFDENDHDIVIADARLWVEYIQK